MMLGKRKAIQDVPQPRRKRKLTSAIQEISFDYSAREDYLTGFHKRKLQRIKHAKEEAIKKDREDKLAARKILREGRKADLEKHVEAVNSLMRNAGRVASDSNEEGEEQEDHETDEEAWDGIKDKQNPSVDHEDEYMDEDRFTTVTVEAVDVSKEGLQKAVQEEEDGSEAVDTNRPDREPPEYTASQGRPGSEKGKRIWTKEPPSGPRKKRKKFRYESKAERKATRYKEKSGNKAKARARKG